MNKLMTLSIAAGLAFGLGTAAYAAGGMKMDMSGNAGNMSMGKDMNMGMNMGSTKPAGPTDAALADGVVQKVDRQAGMVTIQHGELKNIGMPPMTMAYKAKDAAMVDRAKEGEKIRFRLEDINGTYTITRLEKQP
ncbi:copper-binding protein [Paralcaligenes ureilyticus]|uniref:Cu/Ag efflux protein CusF n=1 Tax=Paralcaligenes ureilyticus TaxID=627131 RepID=A0A4V2UZ77_9BURK|nr:copper-binding protein [Paralcaligenes ureilyticus]TCT10248.1 Cu/Ag efflux protein CusF [Paralcaligenes ureilyticus]